MAEFQTPLFGLARPKIDIVVDVSNLAFRAAFRFKDLSHNGAPTGHIYGAMSMLTALQKHYGLKNDIQFVFALDGKCAWRREILPTYKAQRGYVQALVGHHGMIEEVHDVLKCIPGLTIHAPTDEADDVIATHIANNSRKQQYIFSKDRDLWQLMHHHMVRVITSSKDPPITVYQIVDDFHTTNPRLIPLAKALIGDTSDNIPGVKGFSREDLKLILDEMSEPSVDDLVKVTTSLDQRKALKPRTLKLTTDNIPHIKQMLSITTLKADCVYDKIQHKPDKQALDGKLTDAACTSMLEKTNVFFEKRK